MGMINHLLVADVADAKAIAVHDDPSREWDGFFCQGLDRIKLVGLWALIEAGSPDDRSHERMDGIQTIAEGDAGPWVDVLPSAMVSALASLAAMDDTEIAGLAASLCRMEDFEGWADDEVNDLVRSIGDQAETADLKGKTLMVYTSL